MLVITIVNMGISHQLLQVLVLAMTAVVFTASMRCNKLLTSNTENSTAVNNEATSDVLETGKYIVRTTERTDSASVRGLISKLQGANHSDIEYRHRSFTAILLPKDLKKVAN